MASKGGGGRTVATKAITQRYLESLKPAAEPFKVKDSTTRGLSFRVAEDGAITAYVAFRVKGSKAGVSGPIGTFRYGDGRDGKSLQALRDRAHEVGMAARAGRNLLKDEIADRVESESALTVGALIDKYTAARLRGRLRTGEETARRLRRALEPILGQKIEDTRKRDYGEMLDDVADSGRRREAQQRRQAIGTMFKWALAKDLIDADPTAGLPTYDPGTPRDRTLSSAEIRELVAWLDKQTSGTHPVVLKLQLLLGARVGEIAGMCSDEIEADGSLWILPAARSKNGQPRATPLVGTARDIIANRLEVFRGPLFLSERGGPLNTVAVASWLRLKQKHIHIAHFSSHDLRRTFASQLDEMGVSRDVIGALIGHESGDKGGTVLRRHYLKSDMLDRKQIALQAWDSKLKEICGEAPQGQGVVPFRVPGGASK
ncbi:MAG: tyrosine-type recombinase/integrase [Methylocystis sp.]|uniref:tyrosine-type recombinase/integrase n=1 Tax=Methylocystis sp. TaxID=1911079 RepID=UPI003DA31E55